MKYAKLERRNIAFLLTAASIGLLYLFINLLQVQLHGDDYYYSQVIQMYGSLANWFVYNYTHWSGRIIQLFHVFFLQGEAWPFRVLNFMAMSGEAVLFFRLARSSKDRQPRALLLLFCGIQVISIAWIFESMFWPAAMISYCWGTVCMLFVISLLWQLYQGERISAFHWVAACLAACYASYAEQPAAVLLGFLLVFLVAFLVKRIAIPKPFWLLAALAAINTVICLSAPGNAVRSDLEMFFHWPDFDAYGLFRKLALGISYALEMLTGNLLRYLLMAAALLALTNLLHKRWIPFALSIIPAGYYGLAVLEEWIPALRPWLPLYNYMPGNDLFSGTAWLMLCTCLGVSMFVLLAMAAIVSSDSEPDFFNGFLLLAAFASLMIMCATPTIYVSGGRCGYVSNVLINLVAVRLWGQCLHTGWFCGWKGALVAVTLTGYGGMVAMRTLML